MLDSQVQGEQVVNTSHTCQSCRWALWTETELFSVEGGCTYPVSNIALPVCNWADHNWPPVMCAIRRDDTRECPCWKAKPKEDKL